MSPAIKMSSKALNARILRLSAIGSIAVLMSACGSSKDANVYSDYPITLSGYSGSKSTSVSYTGQMARHVLHDSLKSLAGKGSGQKDPALKAKMLSYYKNKDKMADKSLDPITLKFIGQKAN